MVNNRKERRAMAKTFILLKNQDKLTPEDIENKVTKFQKWTRRIQRASEAGERIHMQHLQNVVNAQQKAEVEREARTLNWLIDNKKTTKKEAKAFISKNDSIAANRKRKKLEKQIARNPGEYL